MREREHNRIHPRLRGFDYGRQGAYFVTVCVNKRHWILSEIVGRGLAPAEVRLLPCGQIVERELLSIPIRFPSVRVENYVIMPNHIHILLHLGPVDTRLNENGTCLEQAGANTCLEQAGANTCLEQAGASPRPTLPQVIGAFKSLSTRSWKKELGNNTDRLWQTSYHDHIIRNKADYRAHWAYIDGNPAHWTQDEYYCE